MWSGGGSGMYNNRPPARPPPLRRRRRRPVRCCFGCRGDSFDRRRKELVGGKKEIDTVTIAEGRHA